MSRGRGTTAIKQTTQPEWCRRLFAVFKARREQLGYNYLDMTALTGVGNFEYSRLERGISPNPTVGTLQRIATALSVELTFDVKG